MSGATVKRGDWEEENVDEDEIVAVEGNPYKVVQRGGRWLVVKRDSGNVVPGGDHGRGSGGKKKAIAHFQALEIATHGEAE